MSFKNPFSCIVSTPHNRFAQRRLRSFRALNHNSLGKVALFLQVNHIHLVAGRMFARQIYRLPQWNSKAHAKKTSVDAWQRFNFLLTINNRDCVGFFANKTYICIYVPGRNAGYRNKCLLNFTARLSWLQKFFFGHRRKTKPHHIRLTITAVVHIRNNAANNQQQKKHHAILFCCFWALRRPYLVCIYMKQRARAML